MTRDEKLADLRVQLNRSVADYREHSQALSVDMSKMERLATQIQALTQDAVSTGVLREVMAQQDLSDADQQIAIVEHIMEYLGQRSTARTAEIYERLVIHGLAKDMSAQRLNSILDRSFRFRRVDRGVWELAREETREQG